MMAAAALPLSLVSPARGAVESKLHGRKYHLPVTLRGKARNAYLIHTPGDRTAELRIDGTSYTIEADVLRSAVRAMDGDLSGWREGADPEMTQLGKM